MLKKWLSIGILGLTLVMVSGTALAQEEDCGLELADCDLLTESDDAMHDLQSAVFNIQTEFGFDDQIMGDSIVLRAILNGAYTLTEADEADEILRLINGVNADMNVIIEIPEFGFTPES